VTVTTLGSVGGSCAGQSPTCRSIHFSVRALRVGGGAAAVVVLAGDVAATVDVGCVDVRSALRSFAAQPASTVDNASEAAKQRMAGKPLEMARGVTRALIDHPVIRVGTMRGPVASVGADRVIGGAQLKRLGLIQRTDDDLRRADGVHETV
jgi:hypothetical protein